jgi:uncharacterized protein YukE
MTKFGDSVEPANQSSVDSAASASGAHGTGSAGSSGNPSFSAPPLNLPAFPDLKAHGGRLKMDIPDVKGVAASVGTDHATANNGLNALNAGAPLGEFLAAGWAQADNLGSNVFNAYWGMAAFTNRLVSALEDMSGALRQAARKVSDADDVAAADAKQVKNTLLN